MQNKASSVEEFLDDLIDYEGAARLLDVVPKTIPVAISRGTLALTRYRRGRKNYLSKTEILDHLQRQAIPARMRDGAEEGEE